MCTQEIRRHLKDSWMQSRLKTGATQRPAGSGRSTESLMATQPSASIESTFWYTGGLMNTGLGQFPQACNLIICAAYMSAPILNT